MTGVNQELLSDLIGDIYQCALDKDHWVPTLERLAGVFKARNGTLTRHGMQGFSFEYTWGASAEILQRYNERFVRINPLLTMGWHFDVDEPITLGKFMPPEELRRTTFYRDFLVPVGWFDFIATVLAKSATEVSVVSFAKGADDGEPDEQDVALMRLLVPHLRRATIFHGIVDQQATRSADLAAMFDLISAPALLLDQNGRCIEANTAARQFLEGVDTLRLEHGRVRARDQQVNGALDQVLGADALRADRLGAEALSFPLTGRDGQSHVVHLLPLMRGGRGWIGGPQRAVAAMFIQSVGDLRPLPGEVLVKLYGLTHAETRLIGLLAQDLTLQEAAAALGTAITTARTHLRHIFQKTGTSRQSQLMKLVLSPRPPIPA